MSNVPTSPPLFDFNSTDELNQALALRIAELLRHGIANRGSAALALSGGSTPVGLFRVLATLELPWDKVYVTLVDERWVDVADADSNERLVRDNLLQQRARAATFIGLRTHHAGPRDAEAELCMRLAAMPWPLDVVVLGMGSDGHTASWFPQDPDLGQALALTRAEWVIGMCPPGVKQPRMTLTLAAVLNSRQIIVHITGRDKRAVLDRALAGESLPIAAVLEQSQVPVDIYWAPLDSE